jgi:methylated-DNA-[protein]-cysteine S-methyltransferase
VASFAIFETDLGWVGLMRSAIGLSQSTLPRPTPIDALQCLAIEVADTESQEEAFGAAPEFVRRLLSGCRASYEEALDLSAGTAFQQRVWKTARTIRWGQIRSYGWIAEEIGNPLAAHAVGAAIARNRLPLFIPCHRVVAANGDLGGFGSGHDALPLKRSLLRREGVYFDGPTFEQIRGVVSGER